MTNVNHNMQQKSQTLGLALGKEVLTYRGVNAYAGTG